ncbi:M1 family metallopeptidase [Sporanaerobacter acetigenes]|uniref:Peptidase family M1 n=1 Tax=Sporanaerobacter acetigenes DSM 13106 TaxID=1123281 RepID=A0A1M5WJZ0_9FIRM|nr:M1 family metallopeptidase [Sporanaerobacter acetigenes]SHH87433.1 Peptidase family M1 [Sporanaerobacter acetigenes DSM 13106]
MKVKSRILSLFLAFFIIFSFIPISFAENVGDINEYKIDIKLNHNEKILNGKETLVFKNNYNRELKEIVFHLYPDSYNDIKTMPALSFLGIEGEVKLAKEELGDIHIEKVLVNKKNIKYTQDKEVLKISLDKPLKQGEKLDISMDFTLKIPFGRNRLGFYEDVYSLTNWYPMLSIYDEKTGKWDENPYHPVGESNYSDVANYNVHLTVPKDMVVAPTGSIIDEKIEGLNKTLNIKAENVRDFVFMMSPKYKVLTKEIDGVKLYNYYLPGDKKQNSAQILLDEAGKAVSFLNKKIGKYAYDELRIAETGLLGGAMEYPQIVQMGFYQPIDGYEEEYIPSILEMVVHEVIHQWWYVGVGNNEYKEPFLDESLTVFTTAYYFENEYGKYNNRAVNMKIRRSIYESEIPALNSSVDDFKDFDSYVHTIYTKGPQFFEDLRKRVGEEKFTKILQNYYKKFLFKNATIVDLLNTIEEVAGKGIRKTMEVAVSKPNYFPQNIQLTQEEDRAMEVENKKKYLSKKEKENGLVVGSLILRCLNGEEIVFVKPNNLSQIDAKLMDYFIENMSEELQQIYGLNIKVVEENRLTEKDKLKNLIVFGYPKKSSIMNKIGPKLPINPNSDEIVINNIKIKNENISGMFIAENPYNKKKLSLIIFLDESNTQDDSFMFNYNPLYNDGIQFILNVNGKKNVQIKGMYK